MGDAPRVVTFGAVTVYHCTVILDESKQPSDDVRAPLGIGTCTSLERLTVESRDQEARSGVAHLAIEAREVLLRAHGVSEVAIAAAAERTTLALSHRHPSRFRDDDDVDDDDNDGNDSDDEAAGGVVRPPRRPLDFPKLTTADPTDKREGRGGGFCEIDAEEVAARRKRAADARVEAENRKKSRVKCPGCHRFACLCE